MLMSSSRIRQVFSRDPLRQRLLQFFDRPQPKHLRGGSGPIHPSGHFIEWQSLQVAQHDDLLVVGGESRQRIGNFPLRLGANDLVAGGLARIGRLLSAGTVDQRDLSVLLPLLGRVKTTGEIGRVMRENSSKPGDGSGGPSHSR